MLIFDRIDTKLFKAFMAAATVQNFTRAAEKAGMTQSGMSQNIAKLEGQLGVPLFERINKKVLLTDAGKELKNFLDSYSETLDLFIDRVAQRKSEPEGLVSYAMPASCLKTPHFPSLLEERLNFPKIDLNVTIAANDEIFEKLIKGDIDFGFVTKRSENPVIRHEIFAQEQYSLVGRDRDLIKKISFENLAKLPFVFYPGMEVLLDFWRQAYFPYKKTFNPLSAIHKGNINHLDGAITMVRHGLGFSIFPLHCVDDLIQSRTLFAYKHQHKSDPIGEIYLVTRKNCILTARVERVIKTFLNMK